MSEIDALEALSTLEEDYPTNLAVSLLRQLTEGTVDRIKLVSSNESLFLIRPNVFALKET